MSLTEYQKKTVEHIVKQYNAGHTVYLVADEVGLGKTFVAKGIIKKLKAKRVIYIASNREISRNNAQELAHGSQWIVDDIDRLSMLISTSRKFSSNKKDGCYILPLSPATTFTGKGSPIGNQKEREAYLNRCDLAEWIRHPPNSSSLNYALALWMYLAYKDLGDEKDDIWNKDNIWNEDIWIWKKDDNASKSSPATVSKDIMKQLFEFQAFLQKWNRSDTMQLDFLQKRKEAAKGLSGTIHSGYPVHNILANEISKMRKTQNDASIEEFAPDLIILDEFHRFHTLLSEERIATNEYSFFSMFQKLHENNGSKPKILLLSATPYQYGQNIQGRTDWENDDNTITTETDSTNPFNDFDQLCHYMQALDRYSWTTDQDKANFWGDYYNFMCRTERKWLQGNFPDQMMHDTTISRSSGQNCSCTLGATEVKNHIEYTLNYIRTALPYKDQGPVQEGCLTKALGENTLLGEYDIVRKYLDETPEFPQFSHNYKSIVGSLNGNGVNGVGKDKATVLREKFSEKLKNTQYRIRKNDDGECYKDNLNQLSGHVKWNLLMEHALPEDCELRLWVSPVMPPAKSGNEPPDYSKTLVFCHYQSTSRAVAALSSMVVQRRLLDRIGELHIPEEDIQIPKSILDPFKEWGEPFITAVKCFFNTTHARRVLTAYAADRGYSEVNDKTVEEYCKEYRWNDMLL